MLITPTPVVTLPWFWIFQIGFNLCFALTIILWWRERQARVTLLSSSRVDEFLQLLEERVNAWENEVRAYRERLDDQLRQMLRVGEHANRILHRSQEGNAFSPSVEETELRATLETNREHPPAAMIPRLHQLEQTKERLRSEITLDLRTLLRDHLA